MELVYTERNWLALLGMFVCAGALALTLTLQPLSQETRTDGPIMHVSLATPVEPPPVPVPPTLTPAQHRQATSPTSSAAPTPAPTAQAPSAAPASPQAPVAPPSLPAPSAAQVEGAYAAVVRRRIEQEKVYPTSREARIEHPQGTVECWFVLSRDGALVDAGVSHSAGNILDRQALVTIRRGRYAPFPQEAFVGESQHRFTVELAFRLS